MQCGDLDRHLEAFLDGQLDRVDGAMLRRHLVNCRACQARIERLRQFERDTQRGFRALERAESVWQDLGLDLVASSRASTVSRLLALPRALPPPRRGSVTERPRPARRATAHAVFAGRPSGRAQGSRIVGALLLAMAVGAVYQLARPYLYPVEDPAADAYRQFLRGGQAPALRSADSRQLEAWLAAELGIDATVPATPAGHHLVGADRAAFDGGPAGMLIYNGDGVVGAPPVLLFVRPLPVEVPAPVSDTDDSAGPHELSWDSANVRYTVVGHEPIEELRRFAE